MFGNGTHFQAEQLLCGKTEKRGKRPLGVMTLVCVSKAVARSPELVLIVSSPEGYGGPRGKGKGGVPSQEGLEPGEGAR